MSQSQAVALSSSPDTQQPSRSGGLMASCTAGEKTIDSPNKPVVSQDAKATVQ